MISFRLTASVRPLRLMLCSSVASLALTGAAHAQEAVAAKADGTPPVLTTSASAPGQDSGNPNGNDDAKIVVSGVRASLQSAESLKRNAPQMVDSIVAQDIGKLPDRNVAEALQRISGIQIQRNYGEGSAVAIRGLTQVRTELNGRDIFTAGGANLLSLEDIPSELLSRVDVYKNPSADLIEDQLSGVINFRTRKPFDFNGLKFAATATESYFDLVGKDRPSFSGLLSDRWDTGIGEIGILVDVAYQRGAFRQDNISTEPFYTLDPKVPGDAATLAALGRSGQTTTLPHGTGIGETFGERRRLGTDVALQWRPTSTLEFTGEIFRSDYKISDYGYSFYAFTGNGAITPQPGAAFTYAPNGDFQSGTFQNLPINSNTALGARHSITTDYSLNAKWQPASNLTVISDFQHVHATTQNLNSIVALVANAGTVYQNITGAFPVIHIGPTGSLTNPASYTNGFYLDDLNHSTASDTTARIDADYRFSGGILSSIKAGLRYADRINVTADTGYRYIGLSGPATDYENVNLNNFLRGEGDLFGNVLAFPLSTIQNYAATRAALGINSTPSYVPSGTNRETQKTYTAYAAAFFNGADRSVPIDGNIGVRLVRTEEDATGYYQQSGLITGPNGTQTLGAPAFNPIGFGRNYTSFLPSLNLRGHITDTLQLRFAASKNISRPTFAEINPSLTINQPGANQTPPFTTSGGNPYLMPMTSKNLDVSLEWYFSRTGSLSAAGFYKDIDNYIQTAVVNRTINFGSDSYVFQVTSYTNAAKAKVKGMEVSYQQFFDFLPGVLRGLGGQANFRYVDSHAPSPGAVDTSGNALSVPLENLSKYSYNLIGIYELGRVSARVAYNWRSNFVETTAGNGTGNLPVFDRAFGQLDASVTFNVTPHFSLTFDGVNLTDTRRSTYFGIDSRPRSADLNDRRFSGTARITF
jgi:TonB-dependent receptor